MEWWIGGEEREELEWCSVECGRGNGGRTEKDGGVGDGGGGRHVGEERKGRGEEGGGEDYFFFI